MEGAVVVNHPSLPIIHYYSFPNPPSPTPTQIQHRPLTPGLPVALVLGRERARALPAHQALQQVALGGGGARGGGGPPDHGAGLFSSLVLWLFLLVAGSVWSGGVPRAFVFVGRDF